jgi:hypothetical protein
MAFLRCTVVFLAGIAVRVVFHKIQNDRSWFVAKAKGHTVTQLLGVFPTAQTLFRE